MKKLIYYTYNTNIVVVTLLVATYFAEKIYKSTINKDIVDIILLNIPVIFVSMFLLTIATVFLIKFHLDILKWLRGGFNNECD